MRRLLLILSFLSSFISIAIPAAALSSAGVRRSVFKIQTVKQEPLALTPWKRSPQAQSSGTGFFIGDGMIMTNAHVVANATYLAVLRDGDPEPLPARVLHVAHDCDLAVITTVDDAALKGIRPLAFGSLPRLHSPVSTIGFPKGGEQISMTGGVVSRIDFRMYSHSGVREHLLIQVDSAINPGNSGGPVMQGRKVIGVAFQAFTDAENTGYIIPTAVVHRFLADIQDGRYDGHPEMGVTVLAGALANPGTAAFHGLSGTGRGIKVVHVHEHGPAHDRIRSGDVMTQISGHDIGTDGKINFQGERIYFEVIFDLRQFGETVDVTLWRDGREMRVQVPVQPFQSRYFAGNHYEMESPYAIVGGLVFAELSRDLLETWGKLWFRASPVALRFLHFYADYAAEARRRTTQVVLAGKLPHPLNTHEDGTPFSVLRAINGQEIMNLADVVRVTSSATEEYLRFEFLFDEPVIALPTAATREAEAEILRRYQLDRTHVLRTESMAFGGVR